MSAMFKRFKREPLLPILIVLVMLCLVVFIVYPLFQILKSSFVGSAGEVAFKVISGYSPGEDCCNPW